MNLTTRRIDTREELLSLEPVWNELLAASGSDTVFLTHEWMDSYWKHFIGRRDPFVLVLENGRDVVGLAPMAVNRTGFLRGVEFLGGYHADYQDVILLPEYREEGLRTFLDDLSPARNGWDLIDMRKIRDNSPNLPFLGALCSRDREGSVLARHDVAPFLGIRESWNEYVGRLSRKMMKDTERQTRRLGRLGELVIDEARTPGEIDRLLVLYHRQKGNRRYSGNVARDSLGTGEGKSFLRDIAQKAYKNGWLNLSYLALESLSEPLAISVSFRYRGTFLYWLPSINSRYLSYAPGRVLLLSLLRDSFDRGLEVFDFLCGAEPYKYRWLTEDRSLYRVSIYADSLRGHSGRFWKEHLRPHLRENSSLTQVVRKTRKILQTGRS